MNKQLKEQLAGRLADAIRCNMASCRCSMCILRIIESFEKENNIILTCLEFHKPVALGNK